MYIPYINMVDTGQHKYSACLKMHVKNIYLYIIYATTYVVKHTKQDLF